MRSILFFFMLMHSVQVFGMIGLFSSENKLICSLCEILSCSREELLTRVGELQDREDSLQRREREFEEIMDAEKTKFSVLESERFLGLKRAKSELIESLGISEDGQRYALACTPEGQLCKFKQTDFERDPNFLSCGLYPFLFSEHFKFKQKNGARLLENLSRQDLEILEQAMKHPKYMSKKFKCLDNWERCSFNEAVEYYGLKCSKNGKLIVLGTDPEKSRFWDNVEEYDDSEDQSIIYYTLNLAGVLFEFVAFDTQESPNDFIMSHWVTQEQWSAVMSENPAHFAGRGSNLPMENISYNDIVNNFLPKLNALMEEQGFEGKLALPSENQWESFASKNVADDFNSNKHVYSDFGKDFDNGQPSSVKSKSRGKLGAWMFGSMCEWLGTADASGDVVIRGGSWDFCADSVGSSTRYSVSAEGRDRSFGFRLFRTIPELAQES